MDLERGSGLSLWRQIEQQLETDIRQEIYAAGQRLPTEAALAARFSVNRHTVRRAVAALAERGLARVEQGRGTFVQEHVIDYAVGRRTRFTENVAHQQREPGGRLLRAAEMPADETAAQALEITPGEPLVLFETLREADDRPVVLGTHHYPKARFHGIVEAFRETGSITGALARFGVTDYTRKVTRVTARMPSADEARHLQQPANRPIIYTESINVDADGTPVQYGVARFSGDRVQLVFET